MNLLFTINSFCDKEKKKVLQNNAGLFMLVAAFLILPFMPGAAISANASFAVTGGLGTGPAITDEGETEVESIDTDSLESNVVSNSKFVLKSAELNTDLSTGDHYTYLSSDEKILYDAIYYAVTNKKYIPYSVEVSSLTSDEKAAYRYIYYTGSTSFSNSISENFSSVYNRAAEACYFDHPDMVEIYMCWPAAQGAIYSDNTYSSYLIFKARYDDTKFSQLDAQIQTGLTNIVSEIKENGLVSSTDDAITELNVHDYYASSLKYDSAAASGSDSYFNLAHTAWGSLCGGTCVCDGYSVGYEMILEELGIDAMVIAGTGNGGGHAWNIVKLGSYWYEVDTTWAVPSGSTSLYHSYFNRTTDEYTAGIGLTATSSSVSHVRTTGSAYCGFRMPQATGTFYTYDYLSTNYASELYDYSYVAVTGISLDNAVKTIEVGESFENTVTISPDNASRKGYKLTSSNSSAAEVYGNTVYGVAEGTAVITYITVDGSYSATCTVTVTDPALNTESQDSSSSEASSASSESDSSSDSSSSDSSSDSSSSDSSSDSSSSDSSSGSSDSSSEDSSSDSGTSTSKNEASASTDDSTTLGAATGTTVTKSSVVYKVTGDSTISITDAKSRKGSTLSIPSNVTINGKSYAVTSIASGAFKNNKKITTIKGGKNLTTISKNAFYGCSKLKTVNFSSSKIKTIGAKAFFNCQKLSKVVLNGNYLTGIGKNSFKKTGSSITVRIKASKKAKYNKLVKKLKKAGAKTAKYVLVK